MARLLRCAALLALLPTALCRIGYDLRPTQTDYAADQFDAQWGWTPMPTSMPMVFGGLERRQGIAPNSTCGFISGLSTSVLTCNGGLDCGFNSGYNAAGCCSGYTLVSDTYTLTNCDFFTACYDSTAAVLSCSDSDCVSNTHNLLCTESSIPYCITWSFTDIGYTNIACDEVSGLTEYLAITYNAPAAASTITTTTNSSVAVIITSGSTTISLTSSLSTTTSATSSTTSSVPAPPPVVVTTSASPSGTSSSTLSATTLSSASASVFSSSSAFASTISISSASLSASSASASAGAAASSSSANVAGAPSAVPTNSASTGSSAETATETQTAPASSSTGSSSAIQQNGHKSSTPTGAIVGGVIGGIAVLAFIAGLIWFCMRRRRKDGTRPPTPEVSQSQRSSMPYPYSPVSPNTQGPSQYGSPEQVHEFPAAAPVGAGAYVRSHPMDHPQSGYRPGGYSQSQSQSQSQAHEISSEGTGSSRPLSPGYEHGPEVVQGGYRGVDPTGGGYNNPSVSYGAEPGFYGRPYSEMP